jgi:hypothetical protein
MEDFNKAAKEVDDKVREIGDVALNLNKKNSSDDSSKKEFEVIMGNFNDVNNLFRDLSQGTAFYTKLNDIISRLDNDIEGLVTARRL